MPPTRRRTRALLLDLDGTLLDSDQSIRETMNAVLAERGRAGFSAQELAGLIGRPLRDILAAKEPDRAAVEAMAHRYRAVYNESGWVTVGLHPGLVELAAELQGRGWRVGVVTSKGQREAETLLRDLGLRDAFGAVVGDDDRRPLKPHPAPVLEACRLLGVEPAAAAMVGDTPFDVEAGRGAGAFAVGVLWGHGSRSSLEQAGAHAVVADAAGLRKALREWELGRGR